MLKELSSEFQIESVMTFGCEPLLSQDITFAIHKIAKAYGIPIRQIITNCYLISEYNIICVYMIELDERINYYEVV